MSLSRPKGDCIMEYVLCYGLCLAVGLFIGVVFWYD